MIQREVAERLVAAPGSKAYGLPSVVVGLNARGKLAFRVPPQVFYPPPNVESAVVVLERTPAPEECGPGNRNRNRRLPAAPKDAPPVARHGVRRSGVRPRSSRGGPHGSRRGPLANGLPDAGPGMSVFQAPAKVNLSLLVGPAWRRRLSSDRLARADCGVVRPRDGGGSRRGQPASRGSGARRGRKPGRARRWRSVRERVFVPPMAVELVKEIPVGTGLGGGSSDAAAMLLIASSSARQPRSLAEELAPTLGADVPLFLDRWDLQISGFGEKIEPQPPLDGFALAVVVPDFELSTAEVYRQWDRLQGPVGDPTPSHALPAALREGMPIRNDLTPAAIDLEPALGDFLADLRGAWETAALMTGSGSACFGFFPDLEEATDAARAASGGDQAGSGCGAAEAGSSGSSRPELRPRGRVDAGRPHRRRSGGRR